MYGISATIDSATDSGTTDLNWKCSCCWFGEFWMGGEDLLQTDCL